MGSSPHPQPEARGAADKLRPMPAPALVGPARPGSTASASAAAVVAVGCAVLVLRPLFWNRGDPTAGLTVLFAVLLAVGALWPPAGGAPAPDRSRRSWSALLLVLAVGVGAFALGRLLGGGHPPAPVRARFVVLNTLAAVAEEAFFRRLAYALLAPGGALLAVGGTSMLFALAHVGVYGWWVVPLDLAAGLVLGWQRWASGSWTVPALTHVVANILVVI